MRSDEGGETGCTFIVDLPVTTIKLEPVRRLSNIEKLAEACGITMNQLELSRPRVLVVDDSALNRKMLVRLLSEHSDLCQEAENGQRAVEMITESMQPGKIPFDAVIMDFIMPIMAGPEAIRKIKKLGFNGRIVGLTGNVFKEDVETFTEAGAEKVLFKPIGFDQLREIIPGKTHEWL